VLDGIASFPVSANEKYRGVINRPYPTMPISFKKVVTKFS